jgi:hypothetical protein
VTYATKELSIHDGEPVELFGFEAGAAAWRYCTGTETETYLGDEYDPVPIGRGIIEQTGEIHRDDLSILLPRDNPLAAAYRIGAVEGILRLTIWRKHRGTDPIVYWKGRVINHTSAGAETVLRCESIFSSLKRPGLRRMYQRGCPHVHYGRGCGLDMTAYAVAGTVSAITGTALTVPEAAASADGYFSGGMVECPAGTLRFILRHQGELLTLAGVFPALAEDVAVTLYPGCDRSRETCDTTFANILNYGGFPWIPTRNPFDGHSMV